MFEMMKVAKERYLSMLIVPPGKLDMKGKEGDDPQSRYMR